MTLCRKYQQFQKRRSKSIESIFPTATYTCNLTNRVTCFHLHSKLHENIESEDDIEYLYNFGYFQDYKSNQTKFLFVQNTKDRTTSLIPIKNDHENDNATRIATDHPKYSKIKPDKILKPDSNQGKLNNSIKSAINLKDQNVNVGKSQFLP